MKPLLGPFFKLSSFPSRVWSLPEWEGSGKGPWEGESGRGAASQSQGSGTKGTVKAVWGEMEAELTSSHPVSRVCPLCPLTFTFTHTLEELKLSFSTNFDSYMEQLKVSFEIHGYFIATTAGNSQSLLRKFGYMHYLWLSNSTPKYIYLTWHVHGHLEKYSRMIMAVKFIIIPNWKKPKWSLEVEWI